MEDGRCKLGLAGRLELVRLVEGGESWGGGGGRRPRPARAWRRRAWPPCRTSRRRRRIGGGIGGGWLVMPSGTRGLVCGLGRRCRGRVRGSLTRRLSGGSSMLGSGPTTGPRGWRAWSAIAARRFGRCWPAMVAHGGGAALRGGPTGVTSGLSRARCCTWTPSVCSAFKAQGTGRRATATRLAARAAAATSTPIA